MDTYSVSKVKTFNGREGLGFNATLLRNGAPVAAVMDDAHGGPSRFSWLDSRKVPVEFPALDHKDQPVTMRGTPEEGAFWAYCLSLGTYEAYGETMPHTPDVVVENLVNDLEVARILSRRLKREMKDRLLFIEDGKEFFCKPRTRGTDPMLLLADLKKRHPGAVVLNELPFEEALALSLKAIP
ncbi:hypothetical protein [Paraburkholderia sp. MM6662-R1]|uniref:hypothetical protein n=1 Tax=Paraburkholderia sp. MM6662-R1 TaxID=2991066 RepID=UPI003D21B955